MTMLLTPRFNVTLLEEDGKHFYMVENQLKLPGVTGMLNYIAKPMLPPWIAKSVADYMRKKIEQLILHPHFRTTPQFLDLFIKRAKKQANFIRDRAARDGSAAHKLFDQFIQRVELECEDIVYRSFLFWKAQETLKIVAGDSKVASLIYGYGGSLDAFGEGPDGKLWVVDFKTGKRIYDNHAYQVAAYSYAAKETFGLDYYPRGVVVRFDRKKIRFERREVLDIHESFRCFKAAMELHRGAQTDHFDLSHKMELEVA